MPIRIYALARELGIEAREIVGFCDALGIKKKSGPNSVVTEKEASQIRNYLSDLRSKVSKKQDADFDESSVSLAVKNEQMPSVDPMGSCKRILSGSGETIITDPMLGEHQSDKHEHSGKRIGSVLPPEFRLLKLLGRGGMGEVYLVERDSGLSRELLALKTILPEQLGNPAAIERFKKEVSILLKLRHDNIVQFRDFRLYRGYYFFLMEYIEGKTLQEYVADKGPMSPREVLDVFGPLAQALDYAHGKGVIHRDLKPTNIMLGAQNKVYLLDFGIARHQEAERTDTRRIGPGTWEYMAPEQFDDERPSTAMDIYGLGATIYFALIGKNPFMEKSIKKLLESKDKGCPNLSSVELPATIVDALRLSMSPLSGSRPKSCNELLQLMRRRASTQTNKQSAEMTDRRSNGAISAHVKPSQFETDSERESKDVKTKESNPKEITNSLGMTFRLVRPGSFMMGGNTGRRVAISKPFYIGIYPVTEEEYVRLVGDDSPLPQSLRHPITQVTWQDAMTFISRLNRLPEEDRKRRVYRLPTEAEWEFACRAGSNSTFCFGEDVSKLGEYAWYIENSSGRTHAVGKKKSNAYGLYDMHGNVWEWCSDWFGEYLPDPVTDPGGPKSGVFRSARGGAANNVAMSCRSASRYRFRPGSLNSDVGFRIVMNAEDNSQSNTSPGVEITNHSWRQRILSFFSGSGDS